MDEKDEKDAANKPIFETNCDHFDVHNVEVFAYDGKLKTFLSAEKHKKFVATRMLAVQNTFIIRDVQENTVRERWSFPGERSLHFCKRTAIPDDDKKK
jgi:hypothetical protein